MNDVAIIGVGLHPFGRFEGKSAMQMGVDAILAAIADAGIAWQDVQFATGGSWTVANPDAIVGMVGLTGIPFTNVFNACATAASAVKACADGIRLGDYDIGIGNVCGRRLRPRKRRFEEVRTADARHAAVFRERCNLPPRK